MCKMDKSEFDRFQHAIQQRVRGAVYVPPASVKVSEKPSQSDYTECPSAYAVKDMLPAAQEHALFDSATTALRLVLDPLVVLRCVISTEELKDIVTDAGAEVSSESEVSLIVTSEHAFASQITLFIERTAGGCILQRYTMYGRFQHT